MKAYSDSASLQQLPTPESTPPPTSFGSAGAASGGSTVPEGNDSSSGSTEGPSSGGSTEDPGFSGSNNDAWIDTRRRSARNRSPVKYGTRDSVGNERYDPSKAIPKVNVVQSAESSIPASHRHMVKVLAMLANDIDNAGADEPITLKQAMGSAHWPQWFAAMKVEFNQLQENKVWDLVDEPQDRKVLTGRWVSPNPCHGSLC